MGRLVLILNLVLCVGLELVFWKLEVSRYSSIPDLFSILTFLPNNVVVMLTTLLLLLLPTVSSFLTPPLLPTHPKSSLFGIPRKFAKYQGLGNDFICIDARDKTLPTLTDTFSASICDRNFGIGGDGVIFALASPDPAKYDFAMRIYNSDGSEPEMCGNGIRCLAKFLGQLDGKLAEGATYRIHTGAGLIVPVINKDGSVTVQMGKPILEAGGERASFEEVIHTRDESREMVTDIMAMSTTELTSYSTQFFGSLMKNAPRLASLRSAQTFLAPFRRTATQTQLSRAS